LEPTKHFAALVIDSAALLVEHIVELQHVLASVKVKTLDLCLCALKRARYQFVFNRLILGDAKAAHHVFDHVGCEHAHEIVLKRDKKPRLSRIALAAGAAAQLVVDAARLVPLGTNDKEPAERFLPPRARHRGSLARRRV
jgi:hypothetical protein